MSDLGNWVKRNRMGLAVGALAATVAGSLAMVVKGEQKREKDFEAEGQHAYIKGDLHPAHPTTFLETVDEVLPSGHHQMAM